MNAKYAVADKVIKLINLFNFMKIELFPNEFFPQIILF